MEIKASARGTDEVGAALDALLTRVSDATGEAMRTNAQDMRQAIRTELTRHTHAGYLDADGSLHGAGPRRLNPFRRRVDLGASPPGEPPALLTGALRRSVDIALAAVDGLLFEARIWPSTIYARIQELGGDAGRDHAARLPPRPYVRPALERMREQVRRTLIDAWSRAIGG